MDMQNLLSLSFFSILNNLLCVCSNAKGHTSRNSRSAKESKKKWDASRAKTKKGSKRRRKSNGTKYRVKASKNARLDKAKCFYTVVLDLCNSDVAGGQQIVFGFRGEEYEIPCPFNRPHVLSVRVHA